MTVTAQMRTEVSQLYVALFGRAPDAEGLAFWAGLRDAGQSTAQIADAMFDSLPARAYFPSGHTHEEIISSFYVNVLGRQADVGGLAFWTAKLDSAGATPGTVIAEMIGVVAGYVGTDPAGRISAALFNNRSATAQFYAEHYGSIMNSTNVLAAVTADGTTIVEARTLRLATGAHGAIDAGGYQYVSLGLLSADTAISNLPSGGGLMVRASTSGLPFGAHPFITVSLGDMSGSNDSLEIFLVSTGSTNAGKFMVNGIENITVHGLDADATLHENLVYLYGVMHSLAVDGNVRTLFPVQDTRVDVFSAWAGTGTSINARPGFDTTGTLTGGIGRDVLLASHGEYTVRGGDGNDTIGVVAGTVSGGSGADLFSPRFNADSGTFVTILDFSPLASAEGDLLDISHLVHSDSEIWVWDPAKIVLGDGAALQDYLDASVVASPGDAVLKAVVHWFQVGGDTYLAMDNSNSETFTAGVDQMVRLLGLVDLAALPFATGDAIFG